MSANESIALSAGECGNVSIVRCQYPGTMLVTGNKDLEAVWKG